jgi:hypothetical protein
MDGVHTTARKRSPARGIIAELSPPHRSPRGIHQRNQSRFLRPAILTSPYRRVYCVDHLLSPEMSRDLVEELADEFKEVQRASDNGAEEASSRMRVQPGDKVREEGGESLRERTTRARAQSCPLRVLTYDRTTSETYSLALFT